MKMLLSIDFLVDVRGAGEIGEVGEGVVILGVT